MFISDGHY